RSVGSRSWSASVATVPRVTCTTGRPSLRSLHQEGGTEVNRCWKGRADERDTAVEDPGHGCRVWPLGAAVHHAWRGGGRLRPHHGMCYTAMRLMPLKPAVL